MIIAVGILVIIVGLVFWAGQGLSLLFPALAQKLGLLEPKEEMDETFHIIESRAVPLTDVLLAWPLPLSGLLMILDHPIWPFLGLVGGGIFVYASGAFILTRLSLAREGRKIGSPASVKAATIAGTLWILSGVTMIVLSSIELSR